MGGGAWPFLVGGVICLVNSDNERDLSLLTSYARRAALRRAVGALALAARARCEPATRGQLLRGTTGV